MFLAKVHGRVPESLALIIEQSDDGRKFNRGALLNAAIRELPTAFVDQGITIHSSDILCLHDVDMIPDESLLLSYTKPLLPQTVRHFGAIKRYRNLGKSYLGGILMIRLSDYISVNGHCNSIWGWGGEDDEFYKRLTAKHFVVDRVHGEIEDLEGLTDHSQKIAQNIQTKNTCRNKHRIKKNYETNCGLSELKYHRYPDINAHLATGSTRKIVVVLESL